MMRWNMILKEQLNLEHHRCLKIEAGKPDYANFGVEYIKSITNTIFVVLLAGSRVA